MAISRVPGYSLLANLDRQGTDLSLTSSGLTLQYWDVVNYRVGVNTATPQSTLDVAGNILVTGGHVYTTANLQFDLGQATQQWRSVYVNSVISNTVTGTLLTNAQPNITSVGTLTNLTVQGNLNIANITVATITANTITANIIGNVTGYVLQGNQPFITTLGNVTVANITVQGNIFNITGNISASNINAGQIVAAGNVQAQQFIGSGSLLTVLPGYAYSNVNVAAYGQTQGYTNYSNVNVAAYTQTMGFTNYSNVNLIAYLAGGITSTGFINTSGNISASTVNAGTVVQNNRQVLDTGSNIRITGDVTGVGANANIAVALTSTGVAAGVYGSDNTLVQLTIDNKGRVVSAANVFVSNLGNINFSNTTISSATDITVLTNTNGNIYLNAGGTGTVQIAGTDALGLPVGDDTTRPINPLIGYTRYNTSRSSIEVWTGTSWQSPGQATISSQSITPDGVSNVYTLSSNTTTTGVLVSVNGTVQQPINSYNIVNNNQIQFTEIPLTSDQIEVRFISIGAVTVSSLLFGTSTAVTLDSANVTVTGNVVPSANVTYSLGSADRQWRDLWISGNTLYMGGSAVTVTNGQLAVAGNVVGSYSNVNVTTYLPTHSGSVGGTLTTAGQPNITSLNGLTSFGSGGNITIVGNLNILGTINTVGNVNVISGNSGQFFGNTAGFGALYAGIGTGFVVQPQTTVQISSDFNGYSQLNIQNINSGSAASGDIVVTSDSGNAGVGYIDMGINSSTYSQAGFGLTGATDGYLYVVGSTGVSSGNLLLSAHNPNADIIFALGGSDPANEAGRFNSATRSLKITGNINATGNILATGAVVNRLAVNGTITAGVWNGTAISTVYGGTGATTTTGVGGALYNLVPRGEQTGYVLSTSGAGSYSWVAPSAGGATVGQQLTTLRQSNVIVGNTTVIALTGISYTPGAGQLRVYVNGVRQFPAAYTETSNVSYTLSANVVAGDVVFAEIDQFSSFNNFANLTFASNVGNIAAAGLTVQSAINSLETNKAPLASPVFSGTVTGGALNSTGNILATGAVVNALTVNGTTTAQAINSTGLINTTGNVSSAQLNAGQIVTSGNVTVGGNVKFTGWQIFEQGTTLFFAYNGVNKMSLNTNGNLTVSGDVTGFGTP